MKKEEVVRVTAVCRELNMQQVMELVYAMPENQIIEVLFPLSVDKQSKAGDADG